MTFAAPGREGILRPGDSSLWQGRPERKVHVDRNATIIFMGVFVCGLSLFWMSLAFVLSHNTGFPARIMPLFGLIFLYQSLTMMGGGALRDLCRRNRTWHTLTDRHTFIGRTLFGRKNLKLWKTDRCDKLECDLGLPRRGWFAPLSSAKGRGRKIGIRDLADAQEAQGRNRGLQEDRSA